MFPSFVSVMECVNAPSAECVLAPSHLVIYASMLVGLVAGYRLARQIVRSKLIFRRFLGYGTFIFLLALAVVVAFFLYSPDAPLGVERRPIMEWTWISAIIGFALGLVLILTGIAFRLGRTLARLTGYATRLGKPGVVIAIDGPAASGKGTLAKRIADRYRLPCLDTGLLYRAVARDVIKRGGAIDDTAAAIAAARALDPKTFGDPALRGEKAGEAASVVAKIPEVRAALLDYQREFAQSPYGAVLDGRDIGTVVCPGADVKIFVVASPEERARRRHKDHVARGDGVTYEDVLEDIHKRDQRDMGRDISPLWPAKDAITLDTTDLNADDAFKAAAAIVEMRVNGEVS
jgi:cytidylate kinase